MKYNMVTNGETFFPLMCPGYSLSEDNFVGEKNNISIGMDFSKLNDGYACFININRQIQFVSLLLTLIFPHDLSQNCLKNFHLLIHALFNKEHCDVNM